jgi:molecular chaperone IbpA
MEDVAMRNFDFSPLWRSTIGFDRLFDIINNIDLYEGEDSYPAYDIVRTGNESYRISLALAGFSPENITVTVQENRLTVTGNTNASADAQDYIYRSIAARPFERHFSLADYVEVAGANFDNGLLQIDLVRKLPEAMKPRRIEIGGAHAGGKAAKVLEASKAA